MTQSGAVTGGGFSSITLKRLRAGLVLMLSATLGITANASAETSKTFTPGAGSEQPSLELAGVCSRDLTENCGAVSDSAEARVSCSGLAGKGVARFGCSAVAWPATLALLLLRELAGEETIRLDSPGWIVRDVEN